MLVGQDLIHAAAIRAQVTQIEKYNTAVNTFRGKYGYLPGDIKDPEASSFGFAPRGQYAGEGDGNGVIAGTWGHAPDNNVCNASGGGELSLFWRDLSQANLIAESFTTATYIPPSSPVTSSTVPSISAYFPSAKIGQGNFIYVWCSYLITGSSGTPASSYPTTGINYFGLSAVRTISDTAGPAGKILSSPSLTVRQAYQIDSKLDDGLPLTGKVLAAYMDGDSRWDWPGMSPAYYINFPLYSFPASSTSCFDNNNIASNTVRYSIQISGGSNVNCGLSFQLQ